MSLFTPLLLATGADDMPIRTRPILVMQISGYCQEGGRVLIGPHLMTPREVDELVDLVVSDAEEFRRVAKHELDIANTRANRQ